MICVKCNKMEMLQQATDNMANQWDSEYAIWCDLSVAQGREVPAQIEHTVTKDERPPRLVLVEETEEHFLGNYVDGGDYSSGPDIPLIKKLLQEAKLAQASQPEEEEETVIEKFKNPAKNKNLAMDSILQMHNCSEPYQNGHSAVHPSTSTLERNLLFNAPSNMFKKKTKKVNTSESPKNSQSTEINQPDFCFSGATAHVRAVSPCRRVLQEVPRADPGAGARAGGHVGSRAEGDEGARPKKYEIKMRL
ncbi:uncharacterized protein LOC123871702 isoform X4 [Maniola jurtina]|uniref:uncharacterized protein LOC123871702 isoform X4 n=1 Tax=Maniola jurtina TaxID=191418 RepID=UPI001E68F4DE|nr:uncharacterized protein LOC123871702 isoform X4 [Maniola jurtina]